MKEDIYENKWDKLLKIRPDAGPSAWNMMRESTIKQ